MKSRLKNIGEQWTMPFTEERTLWLFTRVLLFFIVYWGVTSIPFGDELFGTNAWHPHPGAGTSPTAKVLNMLSHPKVAEYWWLVLSVCIAAAILAMLRFHTWLMLAIVYVTYTACTHRTHLFHSSGNQIASLFLLYLIPAYLPLGENYKPILKRLGLWLCRMQVIVAYLVSSVYKFQSPEWVDGTAIYYIFSINAFSLPPITDWIVATPFLYKTFTWISLAYQTLFPVLVWFKKIKPWLFFVGILFHLGIAFVMGIVDFGVIMIISYLLFVDPRNIRLTFWCPAKKAVLSD